MLNTIATAAGRLGIQEFRHEAPQGKLEHRRCGELRQVVGAKGVQKVK